MRWWTRPLRRRRSSISTSPGRSYGWGHRERAARFPSAGNALTFEGSSAEDDDDDTSARSVAVKFSDVRDAFEFVSAGMPSENAAYICTNTGTILLCV